MLASIIGAGIAGLTCALELARRGVPVRVLERAPSLGESGCSWYAGGMLAPWCERERAEPLIARLGAQSLEGWRQLFPGVVWRGSLVVAHGRDEAELARFAQRTERFTWLNADQLGELEPDLAGRFRKALYFADEAHLDPRQALEFLARRLSELGGRIEFGVHDTHAIVRDEPVIDCTGFAARSVCKDLRGVKGEMAMLRSAEIMLRRPVRVLHPRMPVYVVPRDANVFMVGATVIESEDATKVTVRSMLDLLGAAYALHPAFGEAEVLETGAQVRPAFPDNLPRIRRHDGRLYVNGLYRHGFLLAPALAQRVAEIVLNGRYFPEVMDEDRGERRTA